MIVLQILLTFNYDWSASYSLRITILVINQRQRKLRQNSAGRVKAEYLEGSLKFRTFTIISNVFGKSLRMFLTAQKKRMISKEKN